MKNPFSYCRLFMLCLVGLIFFLSNGCGSKKEDTTQCRFQELKEEQDVEEFRAGIDNTLSAILKTPFWKKLPADVKDSLNIELAWERLKSRRTKYPPDSLYTYNSRINGLCNCDIQKADRVEDPVMDSICRNAFIQYLCYVGLATCNEPPTEVGQDKQQSDTTDNTSLSEVNDTASRKQPILATKKEFILINGMARWQDGSPFSGAKVDIHPGNMKSEIETGKDGTFSIRRVDPKDSIRLYFQLDNGFRYSIAHIPSSSYMDIKVPFPKYTLSGEVVDNESGQALNGVEISTKIDRRSYSCQSGPDGAYELTIEAKPGAAINVLFKKAGFETRNMDYAAGSNSDSNFNVRLKK